MLDAAHLEKGVACHEERCERCRRERYVAEGPAARSQREDREHGDDRREPQIQVAGGADGERRHEVGRGSAGHRHDRHHGRDRRRVRLAAESDDDGERSPPDHRAHLVAVRGPHVERPDRHRIDDEQQRQAIDLSDVSAGALEASGAPPCGGREHARDEREQGGEEHVATRRLRAEQANPGKTGHHPCDEREEEKRAHVRVEEREREQPEDERATSRRCFELRDECSEGEERQRDRGDEGEQPDDQRAVEEDHAAENCEPLVALHRAQRSTQRQRPHNGHRRQEQPVGK